MFEKLLKFIKHKNSSKVTKAHPKFNTFYRQIILRKVKEQYKNCDNDNIVKFVAENCQQASNLEVNKMRDKEHGKD